MKKYFIRILAIALAMTLLCALLPMLAAASGDDITAAFKDEKFLARVYVLLEKTAPEPIYAEDVAEIEELWVGTRGIQKLDGLEHFTGLKILGCYDNELAALPALPAGLKELYCANNKLTALPALLPAGLTHLSVSGNQLTALPALPEGLEILWCTGNQLTALPQLPSALKRLYCEKNQLTRIDISGIPLEYIQCSYNNMVGVTDIGGFIGRLPFLFDSKAFIFYPQNNGFWSEWEWWGQLVLEFIGFGWVWMRLFKLFW